MGRRRSGCVREIQINHKGTETQRRSRQNEKAAFNLFPPLCLGVSVVFLSEGNRVTRIEVQTETEQPRGWWYVVKMHHADGSVTDHDVSLDWSDHELWSGGRLAPSKVVEMVLEYAIEHAPAQKWPRKFDCARVRRWCPAMDREVRTSGVG